MEKYKIIPLVVDTGTSHDLGITTTVKGMLRTEGAMTATGTGQYALLLDCTLEFLTFILVTLCPYIISIKRKKLLNSARF